MFQNPVRLFACGVLLAACSPIDAEYGFLDGAGPMGESKIYGGSAPDSGTAHDAVVGLHQLAKGGRSVYVSPFCSGTLIRGDVVVTAAHCLSGMSSNKVAIFVGDQASTDPASSGYIWDHLYTVSAVTSHGSYSSSQLVNDIGLLILASDAAAAEGVSPVPELPADEGFTSADVTAGLNLNFVGFGITETTGTGTKLQVDLPLGALGCDVSGCPSSGVAATQISYSQTGGGGPCSGDSGGPAFIDRSGTTYVAGLTSYGDRDCEIYGVSTRTDAFEGWIADQLGESGGGDGGGDGSGSGADSGGVDTGSSGSCGDGVCGSGERCDGRDGTSECAEDCPGKTKGKPNTRYCYVEGVCEGPGCP